MITSDELEDLQRLKKWQKGVIRGYQDHLKKHDTIIGELGYLLRNPNATSWQTDKIEDL